MFVAVEWKKLMWVLFNGNALKLCLVDFAAIKVGRLVKKSVEDRVKDARMSSFYK